MIRYRVNYGYVNDQISLRWKNRHFFLHYAWYSFPIHFRFISLNVCTAVNSHPVAVLCLHRSCIRKLCVMYPKTWFYFRSENIWKLCHIGYNEWSCWKRGRLNLWIRAFLCHISTGLSITGKILIWEILVAAVAAICLLGSFTPLLQRFIHHSSQPLSTYTRTCFTFELWHKESNSFK